MSAAWKAIRARAEDGARAAAARACLAWAIIFAQTCIGAVCPGTGQSFALIFDGVDPDVFQCFLDHLAGAIPPEPGKHRILILDNASRHKAARLRWQHFECRFLPGYSPGFNPIERLWLRLKADYFSDFIARTPDELTERLCPALNAFMDRD